MNEKVKNIKKYLTESKFKTTSEIIESLKSFNKIEWKFFHPFFNMLIEKFSYINFKDLYFDSSNNIMICLFHVKKTKLKEVDLISILYCSIDEICGKFVYLHDENIFVTTEISLEKNDNTKNSIQHTENDENSEDTHSFLCLVYLKETSNIKKKIIFNFNLYFIKKNECSDYSENYKFQYTLKEYLSGSSVFKRLNKNIPMSKF